MQVLTGTLILMATLMLVVTSLEKKWP